MVKFGVGGGFGPFRWFQHIDGKTGFVMLAIAGTVGVGFILLLCCLGALFTAPSP
jgi:hypothetical protein